VYQLTLFWKITCSMGNASLPVRENLMDKAKVLYLDKLVCETSALPFVKGVSHQCPTTTEVLPHVTMYREYGVFFTSDIHNGQLSVNC